MSAPFVVLAVLAIGALAVYFTAAGMYTFAVLYWGLLVLFLLARQGAAA